MTSRTSRVLERLGVVFVAGLYFAAAGIDSLRRAWSSRSTVRARKEAVR